MGPQLGALLLALVLPAFAFGQDAPAAVQPVLAGHVELIEGDVRLFDLQRQARVPKADDPVYEGDAIVTGQDGEVHVRLEDEGLVAVRPGTKMRITAFRAEGDEQDKLLIGLLQGSFRIVTGWIGKFNAASTTVRTPNASIGIRGTDHEPFQVPEDSLLGEPGTYDKVNEGAVTIQSKLGRIEVGAGQSGHAHPRRAPQLLARAPAFFRPTRNEERITRRAHELQQRLQEKRDERRKLIEQRRPNAAAKRAGKAEERRAKLQEKRDARRAKLQEKREARREKAEKRGERE